MIILEQLFEPMKIKDKSHHLFDSTEDGVLWNNLNDDEKKELLIAHKESLNAKNLVNHEQIKVQHEKWLKAL
jgi:hypothetical protein